jgi:TorA maturation chaperone TorD
VQTWVEAMCDSVNAQPRARAYARVADFTRAFIQVETQGFDLLEA